MTRVFILCFLIFPLSCSSQDSEHIVIIGVAEANRLSIAKGLEKLCLMQPKVVGVNLFFLEETTQSHDAALMTSIYNCESIVMASSLIDVAPINGGGLEIEHSLDVLVVDKIEGFTNFIPESKDSGIPKYVSTFEIVENAKEHHFSIQVAIMFDSLKTSDFLVNHGKILAIDYRQGKRQFTKITLDQLFSNDFDSKILKDKIVLVGYLGPSNEDEFMIPLKYDAKSTKHAMYSTEILANLIEQILER